MARQLVQQPQGQVAGVQGTTPGVSGLGGGTDLQSIIGMLALGKGQYGTAWNILKPKKLTATEEKKAEEKKRATTLNKQLDRTLKLWETTGPLERVFAPSQIAPQKAAYQASRNLLDYMLITMVADKRITDQERKYFLKNFPSMIDSKATARRKISEIKNFVNAFSDIQPPAENETGNIDELMTSFLESQEE